MSLSHSRVAAGLAAVALVVTAAAPVQAQFGGILGAMGRSRPTPAPTATNSQGCPEGTHRSAGSQIMGSMAGAMARQVGGRLASFVPLPEFAEILTNAIACRLDAKEQKQAADATTVATRGDVKTGQVKVGDTAEWTSASRKDVKGRSTVTARNEHDSSGLDCITVTDVVIVSGEETTAAKKMCRPKGSKRYSLQA